jgi:hypothetical protein
MKMLEGPPPYPIPAPGRKLPFQGQNPDLVPRGHQIQTVLSGEVLLRGALGCEEGNWKTKETNGLINFAAEAMQEGIHEPILLYESEFTPIGRAKRNAS